MAASAVATVIKSRRSTSVLVVNIRVDLDEPLFQSARNVGDRLSIAETLQSVYGSDEWLVSLNTISYRCALAD
jgi:hypothetical protein